MSWVHLLAVLFAAHVLGDFVLQTAADVAGKRRPLVLGKHALVHAALAWLLVGAWTRWEIPAVVFATHALIDYAKARWGGDTVRAFLADQVTHLAVLLGLSLWLGRPADTAQVAWPPRSPDLSRVYLVGLTLVAGLVATVRGGSFLVATLVRPYLEELQSAEEARRPLSLKNAGNTIGKLERFLIFVLVVMDQAAGIGFLIAAKSVFRFGELKSSAQRMEAEYVIIGTLASFAYAIAVSFGVLALLRAL